MEFFIKKNSTLPKLQIEVLNESRFGYSQLDEMISVSTITLSLFDPEKEVYKLVNRPSIALPNEDGSGFYISYQFTQKETSKLGRYLATFKIVNSRGEYEVPVNDDLWVTIGESFADSEMCCKRRKPINLLTLDIDVVCNDIVETEYTLSSTYPVDGDVDILFDNYIYVNDGDDIVDQLIMTLEKGQNTTTYVKRHNVSCFKLDRSSVLRNISIDVKCNSRYSYRYNDNIDFLITPTPTPTMTPTNTPTPSITPSVTPSVSITQTLTPTPTNTPEVSSTVTPTNTPQVTNTATPTTSVTPTSTPISTSTPTTSVPPTSTPTPTPSSSEVVDTVWQLRRINNFSECSIDLTVYRAVNTLGAVSSNYILGTDGFCYLVVNESPGTVNVTMSTGPYIECSSCLGPSVSQTPTTTSTPTQTIPLITPTVTPTVTITSSPTTTVTPTLTQSQTPNPTQTITSTVTPSVTSTPTVTPTVSVTPSITSSVTPTPTQSAPFVTPTVTIVQPNSISTSFLYSSDNGIMYVNEQDQSTAVHSIIGYSGTSNTEFSVPNFYSGLTSYREDNMVNGPSNIIYVTGELNVSPGDVRVRRVNTITNQVTHEYEGGSSDNSVKTLYYEHGGSEYIALSQRISGNTYITILNASDLILVGNYQYTPYLNNSNNVINSLLYSNGKLLWSMPVGYLPLGSSTAYGTFDLSTNTFTTGSTQSHNSYSERELLVGTDKVYGSTYIFNSNGDTTSIGYGYYDYSNDTYTQLGVKTNPSGFNSFDVGTNNHSTTDDNNGDIYLVWLYDLVHIDGSTGNVVEVIDLVLDDIYTGRAVIFEMEFNEGQDNIWFEYLKPSSQGVIVIFE